MPIEDDMPEVTSWMPVPSGFPRLVGDHAETGQLCCLAGERAAPVLALDQQPQARLAADVATATTYGGSLETVLSRCTDAVVQHLGAAFARIWVWDDNESGLVVRASSGDDLNLRGRYSRIAVSMDRIGAVATEGVPYLSNDAPNDPRVAKHDLARKEGIVAFAGYPLVDGGRVMGVIAMFARHALTVETVDALRCTVDRIAVAIVRARAEDALAREHAARGEAESATRARDEMLAMVAHDLRNPLNAIQMASQLLLSDPALDAEAARKTVHMIQRAGSRMNRLIGDLLDAKQIEAGSFLVHMRPESPSAVVRDALDMLQPIAASKRQQLDTAIEPGLPAVQVDGARIQQVISNLVGNAIKFSPAGSVITIGAQGRPSAVRISVSDTGPGIQPDELPRIFDRYWQGRRREKGGLGLGLAIAKAIVEAHGGCIDVSSAPGVGATFYFDVPLLLGAESQRVERGTVGAVDRSVATM
jgi:signal transduction histidine kinase